MLKKIESIKWPNNYTHLLQWVACLWAGTICFPPLQGIFYGVFALLVWGVYKGHLGFSFKDRASSSFWKSKKTPFYFLLAYLLWMTATIFWSDNMREYFRQFEKLIPLYLLAFVGFMEGIEKHINLNKVVNAFLWGVLIAIGYMVLRMGVDMFVGDTIGRIKTAGIMSLDLLSYVNHRAYIGMTLLMAIPFLYMSWSKEKSVISFIFPIIFICFLCFMSGARILVLLVFILNVICICNFHIKKFKLNRMLLIYTFGVFLIVGIVSKNDRVKNTFARIEKKSLIESDIRLKIWQVGFMLIQENFVSGVGLGDVKLCLLERYKKEGLYRVINEELNLHNQYMQTAVAGGIVAILLLLLFICTYSHYYRHGTSNILTCFFVIYGFSFLFESVLCRNIGVFPIIFFFILFQLNYNVRMSINQKSKLRRGACTSLIIIFLILLMCTHFIPVRSNSPNTYTSDGGKLINYSKLPNHKELEAEFDGVKINLNNEKIYKDYRGDYLITKNTFAKLKLQKPDTLIIDYSLWCYVPLESSFDKVLITYFDKTGIIVNQDYEMEKKGKWQKLRIRGKHIMDRVEFRVVAYIDEDDALNNDNQIFYFTNPYIQIGDKAIIK